MYGAMLCMYEVLCMYEASRSIEPLLHHFRLRECGHVTLILTLFSSTLTD